MEENILIDTLIFNDWLDPTERNFRHMFDSYHQQDCCKMHYLDFSDFDKWFEAVEKFSKIEKIEIKWTPWMWITLFFYEDKDNEDNRVWIFIPWRASNNWYYSSDLTLIVTLPNWFSKQYDVSDYQSEF